MKRVAYLRRRALLLAAFGLAATACARRSPREQPSAAETRPPDELLVERLAIAYGALRDVSGARKPEHAHRYAQVAVDAIAGPRGRHGMAYAPAGGVLPEDSTRIVDEPGIALRAYEAAAEQSPIRAAVGRVVLGDVAAWRTPSARYDIVDQAVAAHTPRGTAIESLEGEAPRALVWALLALQTADIVEARRHGEQGARHARRALDAVRSARARTAGQ